MDRVRTKQDFERVRKNDIDGVCVGNRGFFAFLNAILVDFSGIQLYQPEVGGISRTPGISQMKELFIDGSADTVSSPSYGDISDKRLL